jgi:uroporphyrinogen decarboxylase
VALDLGTGIASYTLGAHARLADYLGGTTGAPTITARALQIVDPMPPVAESYCGDLRVIAPRGPIVANAEQEVDDRTYRDEWGLTRRLSANGFYYDFVDSPLASCRTIDECLRLLQRPTGAPARVAGMRRRAQDLREAGYAVGAWCFAGIFEMVFWLRGYRNGYLDFAARPAWVERLMDALLEVHVEFWDAMLDEMGEALDVALMTEDLGTQTGLMISPAQFRRLVKPRIGTLIASIKSRSPSTRVLLHSCGAIAPIIGDLVDIGVDILNPLQPGAAGMDARKIKSTYGSDLSFHGAIDIQQVLCRSEPEAVRGAVREMIEILGVGGGYVVAPAHCIQPDVPPENILALVQAVREYASYPGC